MTTFARAARRKTTRDRIAEYLTEHGQAHADAYADEILQIVEDCGWCLPLALEDAPPLRPARAGDLDGPGRQAFLAAKAALADRPRRP